MIIGFDITITANLSRAEAKKLCDKLPKNLEVAIKRYLQSKTNVTKAQINIESGAKARDGLIYGDGAD